MRGRGQIVNLDQDSTHAGKPYVWSRPAQRAGVDDLTHAMPCSYEIVRLLKISVDAYNTRLAVSGYPMLPDLDAGALVLTSLSGFNTV